MEVDSQAIMADRQSPSSKNSRNPVMPSMSLAKLVRRSTSGGGLPLDGHDAPEFVYVYSDVAHFLFFIFTSLAVDWIRPAEDSHSSARRYFAIRIP